MQTKIEEQLKCGHLSPIALILARATPRPHCLKEEGASIAILKPVLKKNPFCQHRGGLMKTQCKGAINKQKDSVPLCWK